MINTKSIKRAIKSWMIRSYTFLYSVFHKIEKKVLFESFGSKQYSDNPRAISEALSRIAPEVQIVWALDSTDDKYNMLPPNIKVVNRHGMGYYRNLATSACYVTNECIEPNIRKRKGQYFVQTWHGDRVPKKVLYDAWENGKRPVPVLDGRLTDICIAGSDLGESVYRSAFHYYGKVLKVGMPRNDCLVNGDRDRANSVLERLNINSGAHILLFAPTFRDNYLKKQDVNINLKRIIQLLEKRGEDWLCLLRSHSGSAGLNYEYNSQYIDVSDYPDMADLLLISDLLITDYSSSAGDFILRKKPVILAMLDMDEYEKQCRSFNFPLEKSGFLIAKTQEDIESILRDYSDEDFQHNCENVLDYFHVIETGRASQEIAHRIVDQLTKL